MARKKEYVNNAAFLEELIKYRQDIEVAEKENKPLPPIPEYIGEVILKIAENLSKKPNFSGYSFKDDMIGDGIENCLQYLRNFDPEQSSNPFAYFTQIIHFAFLRRIQSEAKQSYIKYKSLVNSDLMTNHQAESKKHINLLNSVMNETANDIITNFESKLSSKKEKSKTILKKKNLEKFLD